MESEISKKPPKKQLNSEVFEHTKELMEEEFLPLIEKYIGSSRNYILQIGEAIAVKDLKKISDNAHPLKSSSLVIGAEKVSDIAKQLELSAKQNLEVNYAKLFTDLQKNYGELEKFLLSNI